MKRKSILCIILAAVLILVGLAVFLYTVPKHYFRADDDLEILFLKRNDEDVTGKYDCQTLVKFLPALEVNRAPADFNHYPTAQVQYEIYVLQNGKQAVILLGPGDTNLIYRPGARTCHPIHNKDLWLWALNRMETGYGVWVYGENFID